MAFPITPRVIKVELYVAGQWVDISSDVYARANIVITRGRRDEQSSAEPQRCTLTINNRSGNYSPRNPTGIYYGSIGRNTPMRLTVELARDTFTRTVASGWGVADTGQTYTLVGVGGSTSPTDLSVSSGAGKISVPAANATRSAIISGISMLDVDITCQFSLTFTDVTGAPVAFVIKVRDTGGTNYAYFATSINTNESVSLSVVDNANVATIVTDTVIAGLTHSSSQALRVRVQTEGDTYRAKVWAAAAAEPYDWQVKGNSTTYGTPGTVSVQGWVQGGNTNTLPVVFSVDTLVVSAPRFFGEVASWPQQWDISGIDVYVPIEVSGITRRLSQGKTPLASALYQSLTNLTTAPVAYWPCEDGQYADSISSAVGGSSMAMVGDTDFATYTGLAASKALPTLKSATWAGVVPAYVATNFTQVRLVMALPTLPPNGTPLLEVFTTGSAGYWLFSMASDLGHAQLQIYTTKGGTLLNNESLPPLTTALQLFTLETNQSGGTISWNHGYFPVRDPGSYSYGGLSFSGTVGSVSQIVIDPTGVLSGATFGHIHVRTQVTSIDEFINQVSAGLGETALTRLSRLTSIAGISFDYRGSAGDTEAMGYQKSATLLDNIVQCEESDIGFLYESCGINGLAYRTRTDLYNRFPVLTLDYSNEQVSPPLEPIDDDLLTRNDVTVIREDGLRSQAQLTTGRLSILDPSAGGVGLYDTSYTVSLANDNQTSDLAGWLLNAGTVDEPRYPTINVNLANPTVVAAALEQATLDTKIGDQVAITNPKTGQTPDTITQVVLGYTENINVFRHDIRFNCTPETPYEVAELDANPVFYIAGDAVSLAVSVSPSATSLSVNVGTTPWITGAVSIPVDMAGERMTVTSISGVSSPQTFTVTRSTNGVVKPQAAGSVLNIQRYFRPVLAL